MPRKPTGTVTFLFTDIEGSTRLLQDLGDETYAQVLADHRRILRSAFEVTGGEELETQGDGFLFAFPRARDAVQAAVAAQHDVAAHAWPRGIRLRVRMGFHTGEPISAEVGYVGIDIHRAARICSAGWGGQTLMSQTTRDLIAEDLPDGLMLEDLGAHRLKDLAHPQHLYQIVAPGLSSDFPRLKSLDTLPNNLPRQLTSFIGREHEIADTKRLLATSYLLTLTGSGGCGKTRLAILVAAELLEQFTDGVWLVELAALREPALVTRTVISDLGLSEQPGRPLLSTLTSVLAPKTLLLLLDNCEHLVEACAQLVEGLLQSCPHLRILATSRQALDVAGETTYRVPSLSVPDVRHGPTHDRLAEYEAIKLFVERARSTLSTFNLTDSNVGAIAQICQRLDGIPLAIELAATRVKVLTVEQIASRLDDRFRLLAGSTRTALPRHQTLRATLDWSYDLLSHQERLLLRWLSVFAGGWALDAAEAVCAGDGLIAPDVLDVLTHLVDKSLVIVEEHVREARYRLLEMVRQYTQEKLAESGEDDQVRQRHQDFFLALAERAEPALKGPDQAAWLARLEMEHDNLRTALAWSTAGKGTAEAAARLAVALFWFWYIHGHLNEGRQWLERARDAQAGVPPLIRARALNGAGLIAWRQGSVDAAETLLRAGLTLHRELGHTPGIADALHQLAHVAETRREYAGAIALFEESLVLFRTSGDTWGLALALGCFGDAMRSLGQNDRAVRLYEEAMAVLQKLGDPRLMASARLRLGVVARLQGDYGRATRLLREALSLLQESGNQMRIAECLVALGAVAGAQAHSERAVRLYGAAEALRDWVGLTVAPADRADYERNMTAIRATLGEDAFRAAWEEGRAMTLEEAIAFALAG